MSATSPPGRRTRQRERDPARLRALIVLGVLVLLAAGVVMWSLGHKAISGSAGGKPTTSACPKPTGSPLAAIKGIQVTVLNSTNRTGLAGSVSTSLRGRGFSVAGVGNDSSGYSGSAEVRYGAAGLPAARTLALQVPGAKLVRISRSSAAVDLVLGQGYSRLSTAAEIVKGTKAATATPGC